jgi:hypothetical protein
VLLLFALLLGVLLMLLMHVHYAAGGTACAVACTAGPQSVLQLLPAFGCCWDELFEM